MKASFERLKENICAVLKEQQIKLGYSKSSTWLYYPLGALNNLLFDVQDGYIDPGNSGIFGAIASDSGNLGVNDMREILADFAEKVRDDFGSISITVKDDMFCLHFEPTAAEYVHDNVPDEPFLVELIAAISEQHSAHGVGVSTQYTELAGDSAPERDVNHNHNLTIEQVLDIFRKYSDKVHVEYIDDDEFDVLAYFEDGVPDEFLYCLADEMGHITYHRFTKADYEMKRR